ncbi:CheR family methyltransferase [Rhodohalobacter sp. 614A]|uniref:CheR family methyltransferase n=1 Tax=Rhodohalobacter sp. 614A TaxID=2908649 RepID=UPI001F2E3E6F|nr:protein-glutamate O-methyltransferase CheR [Rhodohalobacter sp. 614A]
MKESKNENTAKGLLTSDQIIDYEIKALLEAVFLKYGYDFRDYSKAHVKRRILNRMQLSHIESVSVLQHRVLREEELANQLLRDLSINVTEMFRDPDFYKMVREKVVPILKTWSFIKIWHAGCSTGEEVYSMAILLKEENLYDRSQIYATDFNQYSLKKAEQGIFSSENMKKYARNYQASGAKGVFSDYYHAKYDSAIMDSSLKKNVVWANHNLVTDSDFAETQIIICRNVLIYFNNQLQNRVHKLFHSSLVNGGILCLGSKESIQFSEYGQFFEPVSKKQKIFKKKYNG